MRGTRSKPALAPDATIYLLNGVIPGTAPAIAAAGLRPVIGNLDEKGYLDLKGIEREDGTPLRAWLVGVITMRDLLFNDHAAKLGDVMLQSVFALKTTNCSGAHPSAGAPKRRRRNVE